MRTTNIKKVSTITAVFWFLLLYIVAALIWWFISLHQQNERMSLLLLNELKKDDPEYVQKVSNIEDAKKRKTAQYDGEGAIFLLVILIGAGFVFRAAKKRLRLSQQQQNFMMTVTHELKTPVAIAQLNLETLQKRNLDDIQQKKLIANTMQEVNRLNSLCNNILLASRLDAGEYTPLKTQFNVSELTKKIQSNFAQRYAERPVIGNIQEGICMVGEELLVELMFSNLIENAIKYSPKYSSVKIDLNSDSQHIIFEVADEGPGISAEEKNRVFDKFYRTGNEGTRTTKGTGLGLYLCQQIARNHQATIDIKNNGLQGSVFTVTFS